MQMGDVENTYADIEKAKDDLGFEPRKGEETGIPNFVNWFKKYYNK